MTEEIETIETASPNLIEMAVDIVSAYVSNNPVPSAGLPALIASIYAALTGLTHPSAAAADDIEKPSQAQIKKSVSPDALISFLDGKPYKTLKRHLAGNGLTIEQYRERYGLPRDYPSTSANYSAQRSELARSLGLGQQRRKSTPPASASASSAKMPKKAGRPGKAKETAEA